MILELVKRISSCFELQRRLCNCLRTHSANGVLTLRPATKTRAAASANITDKEIAKNMGEDSAQIPTPILANPRADLCPGVEEEHGKV